MIMVVFGIIGWTTQAQQDDVFNAIDSGQVGKIQFDAAENDKSAVGGYPFGNHFRVSFPNDATNADSIWQSLKNYLGVHSPVPGSRIRRLNCTWDLIDPNQQNCVVVQELLWLPDGSVLTRP
jgi:hypothetical protein